MSSEYTLSDYVSLIRGTTYKGDLVNLPGPVLLGLASIQSDGGFRWGAFKTYGGECPAKITLKSGDLYVSLKDVTQSGDLLGSVARIPKQIESGRLTQDTVKLELSGRAINPSYLYWMLRTPQYREYCRSRATGTTTLGLAREDFLAFPIADPKPEQDSLVELLEGIEERIELLAETNATLEAIAQALFKSWFVDFDPVHANAGTQAPSLPPEIQALFPATFTDSPQGPIPEGWSWGTIADVAALNPESWTAKKHPNTVAYIDLANAKDNVIADIAEFEFDAAPSRARRVLRDGDTIVGTVRPGNRSFAFIHGAPSNLTGSTGFAVLRPKHEIKTAFTYLAATNDSSIDYLTHVADGGAYPAVKPEVVANLSCIIPPDEVLEAFNSVTAELLRKITRNQQQAQIFVSLRDTLLPRLISGQQRLPEAQTAIEEIS